MSTESKEREFLLRRAEESSAIWREKNKGKIIFVKIIIAILVCAFFYFAGKYSN